MVVDRGLLELLLPHERIVRSAVRNSPSAGTTGRPSAQVLCCVCGLVRCGRYAATASAASSSDSKPFKPLAMKSRIRALPSFSYRGTTSTSTSLVTLSGPAASATRMPVMPPMLAPIKMTGRPIWSRTCSVSAQSASTV
jgi:hypothetical protein